MNNQSFFNKFIKPLSEQVKIKQTNTYLKNMSKQLTNDIYRTKKKLELLESEGIGQLLVDFLMETDKDYQMYSKEITIKDSKHFIEILEKRYKTILQESKPLRQIEMEL